jgi:cytochrome c oxidase subunit IV
MAERETSVRTYVIVYAALIVLMSLTTGLAFVDLGSASAAVALGIAASKALLVILYFMHVRSASRLTKVFVVVGFYWLALLFGGTLGDLLTRPWLSPLHGGAP